MDILPGARTLAWRNQFRLTLQPIGFEADPANRLARCRIGFVDLDAEDFCQKIRLGEELLVSLHLGYVKIDKC